MTQGSVEQFRENWQRPEAKYCHFTRGEPVNQIQFAFRQNWLEFAKIMEPLKPWAGKKSLEVGAGRGTMSMYFADNGFESHCVDLSQEACEVAVEQFSRHNLWLSYSLCDAKSTTYKDEIFDVVFSYGLLEHFDDENIEAVIAEQCRVLKPGGCWIAYVPRYEPNVLFPGMSAVTKAIGLYSRQGGLQKQELYRNENAWLCINGLARDYFQDAKDTDVYPFPMIGASVDFPFSLNPPHIEQAIVSEFQESKLEWRVAPFCGKPYQAFVVWGWKR